MYFTDDYICCMFVLSYKKLFVFEILLIVAGLYFAYFTNGKTTAYISIFLFLILSLVILLMFKAKKDNIKVEIATQWLLLSIIFEVSKFLSFKFNYLPHYDEVPLLFSIIVSAFFIFCYLYFLYLLAFVIFKNRAKTS